MLEGQSILRQLQILFYGRSIILYVCNRPDVIKAVTHEEVSKEDLGGAGDMEKLLE